IFREVQTCKKCRLHEHAKNGVPGEGNPNARIFFIGEAPGAKEDMAGRPFVGQAGKFLDSLLTDVGIERDDVFIGNIVKHRPPNNRKPKPDEIIACTPYLERQIRIIKPKTIVTLGQFSTQYIFSKIGEEFKTITEASGKLYKKSLFGVPTGIMPTFHPASALYNPKYKIALSEHFKKINCNYYL
ncbi:MAG TPA: type-4 uracil-DNA glycosylase, partial [Candidatus Methylomirabilis sp.]|nr:type-4 uracil-DNA glycosylase [Candidatus Methylomirabilis sp.]